MMFTHGKRLVSILILAVFLAACTTTSPIAPATTIPTDLPEQPPVSSPEPTPTEPITEPTATLVPEPALGIDGVIVFSSNRGGDYQDLYLLDIASQQVTRLTDGDSNYFAGPFSPDGTQLLFTGFGLTTSYVGLMNADGSQAVDISQSADTDEGFPDWSPDGSQIAFTSRRDGNNEIYIMQADGMGLTRLTDLPGDDFAPAWSPDGSQIAFVSDRDNVSGIYNLYVMNADGSNVQRLTNSADENDYSPAWSPDGAWIAFRAHIDSNPADIYLIQPDGSGQIKLTSDLAEDWAPAWSSDSAWIAFQTNRDGNWEIYAVRADGMDLVNLTNNPADDELPYWNPMYAIGEITIANPASTYCIDQGGFLEMERRGDLGEIGVCYFEDNRQCEEWALFRGECPVGGVKVTGYGSEAARFCAITGGTYGYIGPDAAGIEQGTCTFANSKTCDVWEYYNGTCSPND